MKKIALTLLILILASLPCYAEIKKDSDSFDGRYWYYVQDQTSSPFLSLDPYSILTTFNFMFPEGSRNLVISYSQKDAYLVDSLIKLKISGTIWDLKTDQVNCKYSEGVATSVFPIPDNLLKAINDSTGDIEVRVFYHTYPDGYYYRNYSIPEKVINDVKKMYKESK